MVAMRRDGADARWDRAEGVEAGVCMRLKEGRSGKNYWFFDVFNAKES
jgi:hypothetical protein